MKDEKKKGASSNYGSDPEVTKSRAGAPHSRQERGHMRLVYAKLCCHQIALISSLHTLKCG